MRNNNFIVFLLVQKEYLKFLIAEAEKKAKKIR